MEALSEAQVAQVDARIIAGIESVLGAKLRKFETQFTSSTQVSTAAKAEFEETKQNTDEKLRMADGIPARMQGEAASFQERVATADAATNAKVTELNVLGSRLRAIATKSFEDVQNMQAGIEGSRAEILTAMRQELQRVENRAETQQRELEDLAGRTRATMEEIVKEVKIHAGTLGQQS